MKRADEMAALGDEIMELLIDAGVADPFVYVDVAAMKIEIDLGGEDET